MKIEKEYNVQMLANIVKKAIEITSTRGANIDIITAQGDCGCFGNSSKLGKQKNRANRYKERSIKERMFWLPY